MREISQGWMQKFQDLLKNVLVEQKKILMTKNYLKELQQKISKKKKNQLEPFINLRSFEKNHFMTQDGQISFSENALWDVNKRLFGEWTTRQEKVNAYVRYVSMLRGHSAFQPVRLVHIPGTNTACEGACKTLRTLGNATETLCCVHQQCENLRINPNIFLE